MQCLSPRYLTVQRYQKKLFVPCGKCVACRVNKTREWTKRLVDESQQSKNNYFVTLTYDDEHLPYDSNGNPCVDKTDIQRFVHNLRVQFPFSGFRYFVCSEYGSEFHRPHYHMIAYNFPPELLLPDHKLPRGSPLTTLHNGYQSLINREVNNLWNRGFVTLGPLVRSRVSYCAKYFVTKQDVPEEFVPNFCLMSRRPGIGAGYIARHQDAIRYKNLHSIRTDLGTFVKLPRYYDKKVFTDEERTERWTSNVEEINRKVREDPLIAHSLVYSSVTDDYAPIYGEEIQHRQKIAEQNYKLTHKKDLNG